MEILLQVTWSNEYNLPKINSKNGKKHIII